MLKSFVISGVIPGVTNDAKLKNDICRRVSQCLGPVVVNFNVNWVVFRKTVIKQCADYENMIAEWISRRVEVVPITSMPLWIDV